MTDTEQLPRLDRSRPAPATGVPRAAPGLIRRDRFNRWMAEHSAFAVRMICGGAGYGKTSALLSWLDDEPSRSEHVIWITLDRGLSDRLAFWSLVAHRLERLGVPVESELKLALLDVDAAARTLPVQLIRQFEGAGPVTLVVDNGDLAAGGELVDDVLSVLHHVPGFHLVFTTRTAPEATRTMQDLGPQVAVCTPQDLLFDVDEIGRLAAADRIALDPQDVERIHALTRGWPLAARAELSTRSRDEDLDARSTPGEATRALAARLLAPYRAHPAFARLRGKSPAPWIAATDMSDSLTALADALARVGLGLWEDEPNRRFRLQPVLRDGLRAEFEAADPQTARAEQQAMAESHLDRGEHGPAFGLALRAHAWRLASKVYIRHLLSITSRPSAPLLSSHRVPHEAQVSEPVLALAVAIDDFANRRRARAVRGLSQLLRRVDREHLSGRRISVEDVWTQAVITMSRRLLGQHEAAKASLRRTHRMLERVDDPAGELDEALSMFLSQGALVALLADDASYADLYLAEAGITPLPRNSTMEEARLHGIRALVAAIRGEISTAEQSLEARALLQLPEGADRSYTSLPAMLATTRVHLEQGDPEAAARALACTDGHAPTTDLWPLLVQCTVRVRWHRDGAEAALALLDEELELRAGRFSAPSITLVPLAILRASMHLAEGRIDAAREAVTSSARHRSQRFLLTRARLDLAEGGYERAAARAAMGARSAQSPRERQAFAVVAAAANLHSGDRTQAMAEIATAARLAHVHGVLTPFALIPRSDADALLSDRPELAAAAHRFTTFPVEARPTVRLTPRETVVLHAMVEHSTIGDMSKRLAVSENTVKSQLRSLYRKLGVGKRSQAVDEARRRGLL